MAYLSPSIRKMSLIRLVSSLLIVAAFTLRATESLAAAQTRRALPPGSKPYGKTYGEWSAAWWKWALALPVSGHPFVDENWDINAGQSGDVWFLASPFGTIERDIRIPFGKALLVAMNVAEASDLEGLGNTEAERRDTASWLADHAVYPDGTLGSFCIIDGVEVEPIANYRVQSPEFGFVAPTPWIFGDVGGIGRAVADGYFVMIPPLSKGSHTIRFGEHWHFTVEDDGFDFDGGFDTTLHVTVK